MEKSMSRILVETVVRKALKSIKESPERGIRNLVDMALQFSEGRFQQNFFATTQTMLQNENSAYYALVRDVVANTDTERLFTFGMNLGYNGCTVGASRIRENEKIMGCNIPWTVALHVDTQQLEKNHSKYDELILEGESLGIYTWMLFAMERPQNLLSFAQAHPDSAFCIFCETEDLSSAFLDEASELNNIMPVVRYDENAADMCATLRGMGFLYSVWYQYDQKDTEIIINGDLFYSAQQLSPLFTVLMAKPECPIEVQRLVHQVVQQARSEQGYRTLLWEMQGDNCIIDSIISNDSCSACFAEDGMLYAWNKQLENEHNNLFHSKLSEILTSSYPKIKGREKWDFGDA